MSIGAAWYTGITTTSNSLLAFVHRHGVGELKLFEHVEGVMNALIVVLDREPLFPARSISSITPMSPLKTLSPAPPRPLPPHKVVVVFVCITRSPSRRMRSPPCARPCPATAGLGSAGVIY